MHAYRFRILTDEQDDFVRDVEIMASQTFLDFHSYLVRLLELNTNELASFSICNSRWYKLCEITLLDMHTEEENPEDDDDNRKKPDKLKTYPMADSRLKDFIEDPHQRLVYEFDFLNLRTFYLELSKIVPAEMGMQYPRCFFSEGTLLKKATGVIDPTLVTADLEFDELDMEDADKEYDDGLDDSFLNNLGEGYEIEMDQTIGSSSEETFEGNFEESGKA